MKFYRGILWKAPAAPNSDLATLRQAGDDWGGIWGEPWWNGIGAFHHDIWRVLTVPLIVFRCWLMLIYAGFGRIDEDEQACRQSDHTQMLISCIFMVLPWKGYRVWVQSHFTKGPTRYICIPKLGEATPTNWVQTPRCIGDLVGQLRQQNDCKC